MKNNEILELRKGTILSIHKCSIHYPYRDEYLNEPGCLEVTEKSIKDIPDLVSYKGYSAGTFRFDDSQKRPIYIIGIRIKRIEE